MNVVDAEVWDLVADFGRLELEAVRREDWGELVKIREAEAAALEGLGLSRAELFGVERAERLKPRPRTRWPRWEERFKEDEGDVLY